MPVPNGHPDGLAAPSPFARDRCSMRVTPGGGDKFGVVRAGTRPVSVSPPFTGGVAEGRGGDFGSFPPPPLRGRSPIRLIHWINLSWLTPRMRGRKNIQASRQMPEASFKRPDPDLRQGNGFLLKENSVPATVPGPAGRSGFDAAWTSS